MTLDGEPIESADQSLFHCELIALGRHQLPNAFSAVKSEWRDWHAFRRGWLRRVFKKGAEDRVVAANSPTRESNREARHELHQAVRFVA